LNLLPNPERRPPSRQKIRDFNGDLARLKSDVADRSEDIFNFGELSAKAHGQGSL
jgi:hypothetical protein